MNKKLKMKMIFGKPSILYLRSKFKSSFKLTYKQAKIIYNILSKYEPTYSKMPYELKKELINNIRSEIQENTGTLYSVSSIYMFLKNFNLIKMYIDFYQHYIKSKK